MEANELAEIFVSVYMILFSGRAAYLIFVAFLVIGLKNDVSVQFLSKPELLGTYKAPTTGLGEDDVNMPV
eukprot:scaffold1128_cov107-Skeletonema_marinoi.AAC.8